MAKRPPKYTFSGESRTGGDDTYWYIYLLTSGTLSFDKNKPSVDVFLAGAGAGGNSGYTYCGGAGGCSGRTLTVSGLSCPAGETFDVVVGKGGKGGSGYAGYGGAGGETSAFGHTAAGGTVVQNSGVLDATHWAAGSQGGSGGGQGAYEPSGYAAAAGGKDGKDGTWTSSSPSGKGQGTTTRAFGEGGGALYASGGGGGGFDGVSSGAYGGDATAGVGGTGSKGGDAKANTGSGGGGGAGTKTAYYDGGDGASGIVILRGTDSESIPVVFDGTELEEIVFNGVRIERIYLNGTEIYAEQGAPSYTNRLPMATDAYGNVYNGIGYKPGARVTVSGGFAEAEQEGAMLTGYIKVRVGDIIRLKNVTMPPTASGYKSAVYAYDGEKNGKGNANITADTGESFGVVIDGGNVVQFTASAHFFGIDVAGYGYIRINAESFTGDSVITVNETI